MWYSPFFLEVHGRERLRSLSRHLEACRLAEECQRRSPPRWRRFLARCLASLSLRLDRRAARSTLETAPTLR